MKNLFYFIIFLLFAWLALWWYYSCDWCKKDTSENVVQVQQDQEPEVDANIATETKILGLSINDPSNNEVFRFDDNLRINNKNGTVFIPDALKGFETKIADYLGQHQHQELIVTGYETHPENRDSTLLGISRANFMKDLFINAGVNGDRIVTKSMVNDYSYSADGIYNGGILLHFNELTKVREVEIDLGIAHKTLYSNFAEKTFKPDATLANYTLELKDYLTRYPDKKVTIIGHTDDKGEEKANLWFGKQRALNVKKYFASQGIPNEKLKASSKGETSPVVPNDSEANRAKNRRIEISVN